MQMFVKFNLMILKKVAMIVKWLKNCGTSEQIKKRKIIILGDSLLNAVNEKGLSENHSVKVNNIPGRTSNAILDKLDDFLENKPDGLIVHASTNDITKGGNLLNNAKKNLKVNETFSGY